MFATVLIVCRLKPFLGKASTFAVSNRAVARHRWKAPCPTPCRCLSPKNLDRKLPVSTSMSLQYESTGVYHITARFKVPEGARVRERAEWRCNGLVESLCELHV